MRRNRYFKRHELLLLVALIFSILAGAAYYDLAGVTGVVLAVVVVTFAWYGTITRRP